MKRRGPEKHLNLQELESLVARRLPFGEETEALLHLLACPGCEQELRGRHPVRGPSLLLQVFGRERLPAPLDRQMEERLQHGMAGVRRSVVELQEAERLWQQMAAQSPRQRSLRFRNASSCHTLGMAVVLLEECRTRWFGDPLEAELLASDALAVLGRLAQNDHPPERLHDIHARAYAHRGNCLRILGRLQAASSDFRLAHRHLALGTGDPAERADALEHESSLLRDRRQLAAARYLLFEIRRLYADLRDSRGEAKVAIKEALLLRELGKSCEGVETLESLLSTYSPDEMGSDNHYRAHHNLVLLLADTGRVTEAQLHLPRVRRLAERLGSRFDRAREQWLEATVYDRAGEIEPAESCYRRVLNFFVAEGIGYEAALASLELAAMLLTVDRTAEVRELAAEMTPIFLAHDIQREAIAALTLFQQAAAQEAATAAFARETARAVRRAQRIQPGYERHPG